MSAFSFSFGGDDIEEDAEQQQQPPQQPQQQNDQHTVTSPVVASAFPVAGKPQLPPTQHALADVLQQLPSKIAYSLLDVRLDDGTLLQLPRRELWDVRVQLMAEAGDDDAGEGPEGLGAHDVKTGVYEGGFKSWESSVDLVKVLGSEKHLDAAARQRPLRVIELGCGTALPSLALFRRAVEATCTAGSSQALPALSLVLADYNPTVLQLVTLPNFILAWALAQRQAGGCAALDEAFEFEEGELELTPGVLAAFQEFLAMSRITLHFASGGWSAELIDLVYTFWARQEATAGSQHDTILLGAETIYSPFALEAFTEMVFGILSREQRLNTNEGCRSQALVGAKRLYFGVGGSLDDFIDRVMGKGASVSQLREETEGVRRGVVQCVLLHTTESRNA